MDTDFLIGVVGPCAAGKTTLIQGLKEQGYQARQIAQEHSFVKDMWRKVIDPAILIFLDVSFEESLRRRPQNYNEDEHQTQRRRLDHAREHANLYLHTDHLTIEEVKGRVLTFLANFQ